MKNYLIFYLSLYYTSFIAPSFKSQNPSHNRKNQAYNKKLVLSIVIFTFNILNLFSKPCL